MSMRYSLDLSIITCDIYSKLSTDKELKLAIHPKVPRMHRPLIGTWPVHTGIVKQTTS